MNFIKVVFYHRITYQKFEKALLKVTIENKFNKRDKDESHQARLLSWR